MMRITDMKCKKWHKLLTKDANCDIMRTAYKKRNDMNATTTKPTEQKIEFRPITWRDRALYEQYFPDGLTRGCEFSFANLYLWGRQNLAELHGHIVLFSHFDRRSVYPYPVGSGDPRAVLDAIIADSRARGISCRLTGLCAEARETVERLYSDQFCFHSDEGSFDYVYDIHDLADLAGKKYHAKRNHVARFYEACPDAVAEPLTASNCDAARQMIAAWYEEKKKENPKGDYHLEEEAIDKALRHMEDIGMEALLLRCGEEVLAVTMGNRFGEDTVDVNFEKARTDVPGAYAAMNQAFARYLREKYPTVRYLNREEDMGIEGLRKAKRSYRPHHQIEKCWACLKETCYDD